MAVYHHLDQLEYLFLHFLYNYMFTFRRWGHYGVSCYWRIHMNNWRSIRKMMYRREGMHLKFWIRSFVVRSFLIVLIFFVVDIIITVFPIIYLLLLFALTSFGYFLLFCTSFIMCLSFRISIIKRMVILLIQCYWSYYWDIA